MARSKHTRIEALAADHPCPACLGSGIARPRLVEDRDEDGRSPALVELLADLRGLSSRMREQHRADEQEPEPALVVVADESEAEDVADEPNPEPGEPDPKETLLDEPEDDDEPDPACPLCGQSTGEKDDGHEIDGTRAHMTCAAVVQARGQCRGYRT